ncbi:endonuclease [Frigidibacter sp. SD6-1]|uniref:endonuclease n=1 Tax=Frigidibacter sp. SD6-1 TaxID=3032581 RepID=UPI0024DFB2B0|nr:endonuclease [Frigidibacter sp. SD6-1]
MQSDSAAQAGCQRTCWLVATGAGVVAAALLTLVALFPVFTAVLIGGLIALALGALLSWAFCSGAGAPPKAPTVAPLPTPLAAEPPPAPEAPKAEAHKYDWQVLGTEEAEAKRGILAGTAEPKAAKPRAKKASVAKGIEAAMGRTHEEAVAVAEPLLLLAPRDGKADDLKLISGVGPALEKLLNEVGVWHFDQIASWKAKDIAFVDAKLKTFKGRITRDEWVKQARALARKGGEA